MSAEPETPVAADPVMTLTEHLSELRLRIFIGLLAIGIGTVVGWFLAPYAINLLKAPVAGPLVFTAPSGAFFLQLKLALMIGVALASPVVLYELWAFVSPGLTPHERRVARPWVPMALVFLVLGIGVAYLILPATIGFLLGFAIPGVVEPLITVDAYFGFVTTMFLAFGLVMQFPIVIVLLSKVGLVSGRQAAARPALRPRRHIRRCRRGYTRRRPLQPGGHGRRHVPAVRVHDLAGEPVRAPLGAVRLRHPDADVH